MQSLQALTSGKNYIYIFDGYSFSYGGVFDNNNYPSDIVVHENESWYLINDQSEGVHQLFLYDFDLYDLSWSIDFIPKGMELVGDTLITLFGNYVYIFKLF